MQRRQLKNLRRNIGEIWRMLEGKREKKERRIAREIYSKEIIWMDR